jgi:PilZ domain
MNVLRPRERRFDSRLPMEFYLNAYVRDEPQRGFTTNLSETGVFLNTLMHDRLPAFTPVGLEFALPGVRETIWAAGEIRYDALDSYFLGRGIRFTAMASRHARLLREYCYHVRATNRRRH